MHFTWKTEVPNVNSEIVTHDTEPLVLAFGCLQTNSQVFALTSKQLSPHPAILQPYVRREAI